MLYKALFGRYIIMETKKTPENIKIENMEDTPIIDEAGGNVIMEKLLDVLKNGNLSSNDENTFEAKEKEHSEKIARLQAEFDNYRKRTEKEKQEIVSNANANLISEILPTLDHFELALKHNKDKGVAMIYDELNETLKNNDRYILDKINEYQISKTFTKSFREFIYKSDQRFIEYLKTLPVETDKLNAKFKNMGTPTFYDF
jgi:molecular chaperone GrpE (heat shock protein)